MLEIDRQLNQDYWQRLIPKAGEALTRLEEDLRQGTWGRVLSDEVRRIVGRESYYEQQAREENERYWSDYTKNTGAEPRYPIRVGSDWNHPIQSMPVMSTITRPMRKLYGGQE
jgi:hypothetical protein